MSSGNDGEDVTERLNRLFNQWPRAPAGNNVQTVVHQGLGAWGPAAIVACFASLLFTIGALVIMSQENSALQRRVETLEAWNGVNNNTISKIQSTIEYLEKENGRNGNSR